MLVFTPNVVAILYFVKLIQNFLTLFNNTLNDTNYDYVAFQFLTFANGETHLFPAVDWTAKNLCMNTWHRVAVNGPSVQIYVVDTALNQISLQQFKKGFVNAFQSISQYDLVGLIPFSGTASSCANILNLADSLTINSLLQCFNSMSSNGKSDYFNALSTMIDLINKTEFSENSDVLSHSCHISVYFITNSSNSGSDISQALNSMLSSIKQGSNLSIFTFSITGSTFDKTELKNIACTTGGAWIETDPYNVAANIFNTIAFYANFSLTRVLWSIPQSNISVATRAIYDSNSVLLGSIAMQINLTTLVNNFNISLVDLESYFIENSYVCNTPLNNNAKNGLRNASAQCTDSSIPINSHSNVGDIVGGIVGAVALIGIITVIILFSKRRIRALSNAGLHNSIGTSRTESDASVVNAKLEQLKKNATEIQTSQS